MPTLRETRWNNIATSIKQAIRRGDLQPGARIATEIEMANQWNVSTMTVHRALSELQREGWVIRRRKVGTVIADLSIQPRTKIGVVFTSFSGLPQREYLNGIEQALDKSYKLEVTCTNGNGLEEAASLKEMCDQCSAIICYPTGTPDNTPLLKKIVAAMPLVFVDRIPNGVSADVVMTDNYGSMLDGLNYMRSQGHRRIAYIMEDPINDSSVDERYAAYRDFMRDAQPDRDPRAWVFCLPGILLRSQWYDRVESVIAGLMRAPEPLRITAVACQQEVIMATVLNASVRLGISIPGELEVLSFDDAQPNGQPLAHYVHRLVQQRVEMGNMATKRVQTRLNDLGVMPLVMRLKADLFPAAGYDLSPVAVEFLSSRQTKQTRQGRDQ